MKEYPRKSSEWSEGIEPDARPPHRAPEQQDRHYKTAAQRYRRVQSLKEAMNGWLLAFVFSFGWLCGWVIHIMLGMGPTLGVGVFIAVISFFVRLWLLQKTEDASQGRE